MDKLFSRRVFLQTAGNSLPFVAIILSLSGCDSMSSMEDDKESPPPPGGDTGITIEGNTVTLDLRGSQAQKVAKDGGFLHIDAADMLVINVGGTIRAFSSICTHKGCEINSFKKDRFVCSCHGAEFGTDGRVLRGPASRPLPEYRVERDGHIVRITKG